MGIQEEKAALRKEIRQKRAQIPAASAACSSRQIISQVISLPEYQSARAVFCFVGTPREIDTKPLLRHLIDRGLKPVVPLCTEPGIMEARQISSFDDLVPGMMGILEPRETCPVVKPGEIEFAVIPCLTCDSRGYRLGQGGGYYDRYLAVRNFPAAVICRDVLMAAQVPTEAFDQAADIVVTEKNIIRPHQGLDV